MVSYVFVYFCKLMTCFVRRPASFRSAEWIQVYLGPDTRRFLFNWRQLSVNTASSSTVTSITFHTLRPDQNGWHLKDRVFSHVFSWYFDPNFTEMCFSVSLCDHKSLLFQVMVYHPTGDKPLLEPVVTHLIRAYIRLSLKELKQDKC